jgi:Leucine-rich repeat (LRR) protein
MFNDLSFNNLIEIPNKLNLRLNNIPGELNLKHNQIQKLKQKDFFNFKFIFFLDLSFNSINTIENKSLSVLHDLKWLDLSSNCLFNLESDTFEELFGLEHFNLSHNFLEMIPFGLFKNLFRMKILDLGFNKLRVIDDHSFANLNNLEFLSLKVINDNDSSEFFHINHTLNGLVSLKNLFISENVFQKFENILSIEYSLQPKVDKIMHDNVIYFESIFIQYINETIDYDQEECFNMIYLLKRNLNLNLKEDFKIKMFLNRCKAFFRIKN